MNKFICCGRICEQNVCCNRIYGQIHLPWPHLWSKLLLWTCLWTNWSAVALFISKYLPCPHPWTKALRFRIHEQNNFLGRIPEQKICHGRIQEQDTCFRSNLCCRWLYSGIFRLMVW
jgi:hypothetical protein